MSGLIQTVFLTVLVVMTVLRRGPASYATYATEWIARNKNGFGYQFGQLIDTPVNFAGLAKQLWQFSGRQRRIAGFVIRIAAPLGYRLLIRRETVFDRFGKALRIAVEPQIGDADLDSRFYIDCEDAPLIALLQSQKEILNLLRRLEISLRLRLAKLRELRWEDGRLDVTIECDSVANETEREDEALRWLQPLAAAIHLLPRRTSEPTDLSILPRVVYLIAWTIGTLGCAYLAGFVTDRLIDGQGLAFWSVPYSLGALAVVLVWTFIRIGAVPRRLWLIIECILVGIPGFVLGGVLLARAIDIDYDELPAEAITVHSANLWTKFGDFRLSYASDDRRIWARTPIILSKSDYNRLIEEGLPPGDQERDISILLHPGRLGFAWVDPMVY